MISRAVASALLAARHQAAFMSLACTQDDCPNFVPSRSYLGIAELSRSPVLADPISGSPCLAIRRRDMNVATKGG